MPIPTVITDLSATAASNSPSGSDAPSDGDNFLRAHGAFIKQLYDGITASAYPTLAGLANSTTSTKGAGFVGYSGATTYPADTVGWMLNHGYVNALDPQFDIVGDGVTDDSTAINSALASLSGTGKYLYGLNITSSVTTRINVPTKTGLVSDGSWKIIPQGSGFTNVNPDVYETATSTVLQLTGQTASPYTANTDQKLIGLIIEGNFTEGRSCNAIAARNCENLLIEDVEIRNFKHTKAIIVASLTGNSRIVRPYIHDCVSNTVFASHPTFADRGFVNITGIDIDDDAINSVTSDRLQIVDPRIENLNHGATAVATYGNQADGIYQNKGRGLQILGGFIENTDEGIDLLGYDGRVVGLTVRDVTGFGVKLIHGARRNKLEGVVVERAGLASLYVGAVDVTANGDTQYNVATDCTFIDVDPSNLHAGATTACIKIESTGGGVEAVNNRFVNCHLNPGTYGEWAIVNNSSGDVGNMFIRNDIVAAGADGTYLVLAANNFEIEPRVPVRCKAYPSGTSSISDATWTKFPYDTVAFDSNSEFSTGSNRWVCSHPGYYRFTAVVKTQSTTSMFAALRKNGTEVAVSDNVDAASDVTQSACVSAIFYMSVADYMEGWVYQDGTGSKNVVAGEANAWFEVQKV